MKILSSNEAVAIASYNFIDVACVYPITPSSEMAEKVDRLSYEGEKNLFGQKVIVREMQSEAGCAGMLHGALSTGALASSFTCSQGLLLMIPEMFRISAECLPGVIHVSSRSIAKHALSILGDHSDVYSCRQTGWSMICSSNAQEAHDFAIISHMSAIDSHYPFLHFFDGFRTSHEIRKIRILEKSDILEFFDINSVNEFRKTSLNPERNFIRGSNQVDDVYFQCCEALNIKKNYIVKNVEKYMNIFNSKFSTNYHPFVFYGDNQSEYLIIAMGSVCDTVEEVIDYLLSQGRKVGMIKVNLFRPFCSEMLSNTIPITVKKISVLDKSKEFGASGNPLFLDVQASVKNVEVLRGRFGIGGKNTSFYDILNVFENMFSDNSKKEFTIGINDDVSNLSLNFEKKYEYINKSKECKFFGLGSDGMIGSAKNITKIIGENSDFDIQYYPQYDSRKSGGLTISHLRFSTEKIKSEYYISKCDYLICSQLGYLFKYDFSNDLKKNSVLLINSHDKIIVPEKLYNFIKDNNVKVYSVDAKKIANQLGLGSFYGIVMQGAFFKICSDLKFADQKDLIKSYVKSFYKNKNQKIIESNLLAIDNAFEQVKEVKNIEISKNYEFQKDLNDLSVSEVKDFCNGNTPCGTSKLREVNNVVVPKWISENCSQCGFCSFICPHGCIRIHKFKDDKFPVNCFVSSDKFAVSIDSKHCTGCSLCEKVCPGMKGKKALQLVENINSPELVIKNSIRSSEINSIKDSQFRDPLMKFSSACPGCGETGYAKLVSQLFGERLMISNATGCSSIWGGCFNDIPYYKSDRGLGPAWQNPLFEDAAEFGIGMLDAHKSIRSSLLEKIQELLSYPLDESVKKSCLDYIQSFNLGNENLEASLNLINELKKINQHDIVKEIISKKEYLSKKSFWIFGGDGWAYDIGFSGLDHVLSSGENINVLVFDTEIYSNTGGQCSKATPEHASARFALGGKSRKKKNLSKMMMLYEDVYVAQVAMGANMHQCLKSFLEAESYDGPSLIVAYSPCIGHGINGGLSNSIDAQKLAVKSGHFDLFRFDPRSGEIAYDSSSNESLKNEFFENEKRFNEFLRR